MLEFALIFATVLAGFGRLNAGVVVAAALGLMALSYWRHRRTYSLATEFGVGSLLRTVAWRSSWHALIASALAFGGGIALRVIAGA